MVDGRFSTGTQIVGRTTRGRSTAPLLTKLAGLGHERDVGIVWLTEAPPMRQFGDLTVRATKRSSSTPAAFGLVIAANRGDDRQRLLAGRLYERLHLDATGLGLSMQPLAQSVERADRELSAGLEPQFTDALALFGPDCQVVLPFRIG
jgi:hypothetical protein